MAPKRKKRPEQGELFDETTTDRVPSKAAGATVAFSAMQDEATEFFSHGPARRALAKAQPLPKGDSERQVLFEALDKMQQDQLTRTLVRLNLRDADLFSEAATLPQRATKIVERMEQEGADGLKRLRDAIVTVAPALLNRRSEKQSSDLLHAPTIRIDKTGSRVRWSSNLLPEDISRLWGKPDIERPEADPAEVVLSIGWRWDAKLAEAFARLAVHGGTRALYVDDTWDWMRRMRTELPGCMGADCGDWQPIVKGHSDLPTSCTEKVAIGDGPAFAETMHERMDGWVLERLDGLLWQVTGGDVDHLVDFELHPDFRLPMAKLWKTWKANLDADFKLRRHYLQATMATSASPPNGAPLIRLGPRTVKPCLLPATVFALAIASTKATHPVLHLRDIRVNLRHGTEDAHLLGLQLIERMRLHQKFNEIDWPGGYALLAGTEASVDDLYRTNNSLSKRDPGHAEVRIGDREESHVTFFTRDVGFCDALKDGPTRLDQYLRDVCERQATTNERALVETVARRIIGQSSTRNQE